MPGIFAGVTMPQLLLIISSLGAPGLVVVFWYVDQRRMAQQHEEHKDIVGKQHQDHKEMVAGVLKNYKADVDKISMFYERNVELVETTQKLSGDLAGIIHLNTQVQTRLVESIKNNMFCPMVRDQGPKRD